MIDFLVQSFQVKSMSFYEAGMLICFGASWPFAVMKTFKTKNSPTENFHFQWGKFRITLILQADCLNYNLNVTSKSSELTFSPSVT